MAGSDTETKSHLCWMQWNPLTAQSIFPSFLWSSYVSLFIWKRSLGIYLTIRSGRVAKGWVPLLCVTWKHPIGQCFWNWGPETNRGPWVNCRSPAKGQIEYFATFLEKEEKEKEDSLLSHTIRSAKQGEKIWLFLIFYCHSLWTTDPSFISNWFWRWESFGPSLIKLGAYVLMCTYCGSSCHEKA